MQRKTSLHKRTTTSADTVLHYYYYSMLPQQNLLIQYSYVHKLKKKNNKLVETSVRLMSCCKLMII